MKVDIVMEYEGLTSSRLKTVSKKLSYCGFNTIATHIQLQLLNTDGEMTAGNMLEDKADLQPVQPNSVYLKCGLLDSASNYSGKGNQTLLATRRNTAPVMKMANSHKVEPIKHILPTETPIEDEYDVFDLTIQKNIIFYNPSGKEEIGWYNQAANILWLSDLIHNPLRAELLLDMAVSAVYELQRCGTLDVITPIYDKFTKKLEKGGMSNTILWWTGFESTADKVYIDGSLSDPKKLISEELEKLVREGADIFFLRSLLQLEKIEIVIEKCKGKLVLSDNEQKLLVPSHTTLEEQVKAIEETVYNLTIGYTEEFYKLAKEALDEKRIK